MNCIIAIENEFSVFDLFTFLFLFCFLLSAARNLQTEAVRYGELKSYDLY